MKSRSLTRSTSLKYAINKLKINDYGTETVHARILTSAIKNSISVWCRRISAMNERIRK
jgi:hypothetical protein